MFNSRSFIMWPSLCWNNIVLCILGKASHNQTRNHFVPAPMSVPEYSNMNIGRAGHCSVRSFLNWRHQPSIVQIQCLSDMSNSFLHNWLLMFVGCKSWINSHFVKCLGPKYNRRSWWIHLYNDFRWIDILQHSSRCWSQPVSDKWPYRFLKLFPPVLKNIIQKIFDTIQKFIRTFVSQGSS